MNLKEMQERLKFISSRLGELGSKYAKDASSLTDAENSELDQLMAEFNELGPKVERLGGLERARENASRMQGEIERLQSSAGRIAGLEGLAGGEERGTGGAARANGRPVGIGERFATSDAVQEFLRVNGRKQSAPVNYSRLLANRGEPEIAYDGDAKGPDGKYALVTTGTPAYLVPPMVVPGIFRGRDYALTARDVLTVGRTNSDTIYFLRELLYTNAAAEVAQATATGGSSGTKPESTLTFEQDSTAVKTIAHWIPITRQAIADASQLQTMVENRLLVGLERRFNSQVWNGDGTGATLLGILNTPNIQVLDAAAFAADPVLNAGGAVENFDRLMRGATEIELTGDAQATFFAMNPRDLEKFLTVTNQMGQYIGGGPFTAPGPRNIWGYNVAADRAIPEGHVVAGDGTMAAIFDREDANILIDTIDDQFTRNMLTILAEMRAALAVFRPAAFADIELASWV